MCHALCDILVELVYRLERHLVEDMRFDEARLERCGVTSKGQKSGECFRISNAGGD